jgi:hypothetical protein
VRCGITKPLDFLFLQACQNQPFEGRQRQAIADRQREIGLRVDRNSKDGLTAEFASDLLDHRDRHF